jgi:hypothetical protein
VRGLAKRLLTVAAVLVCSTAAAAVAFGATSPWAVKANAVCAAWDKKAASIFGSHPQKPTTAKQMFLFLVESRKMESGILGDLRRISVRRPPAAVRALSLAAADVRELNTVIGVYGAVSDAEFKRDFLAWANDNRANRAFVAAGARGCA